FYVASVVAQEKVAAQCRPSPEVCLFLQTSPPSSVGVRRSHLYHLHKQHVEKVQPKALFITFRDRFAIHISDRKAAIRGKPRTGPRSPQQVETYRQTLLNRAKLIFLTFLTSLDLTTKSNQRVAAGQADHNPSILCGSPFMDIHKRGTGHGLFPAFPWKRPSMACVPNTAATEIVNPPGFPPPPSCPPHLRRGGLHCDGWQSTGRHPRTGRVPRRSPKSHSASRTRYRAPSTSLRVVQQEHPERCVPPRAGFSPLP